MFTGGYDDGYRKCKCFWGSEPGSLINRLSDYFNLSGIRVWDIGCGEGKNAIFLARKGAIVDAWDISSYALNNASDAWPDKELVKWRQADILLVEPETVIYDVVVMYGLLHCLPNHDAIISTITKTQAATKVGGIHIVVNFNNRRQELSAHPELHPTMLAHNEYLSLYSRWNILFDSDTDLHETHPHNLIPHVHSMTRILAQKVE